MEEEVEEKGLLEESGGILERGLDGSLKSAGAFRYGLGFPRGGNLCGGFYLTSEILGLLGGRCDQGRPWGKRMLGKNHHWENIGVSLTSSSTSTTTS